MSKKKREYLHPFLFRNKKGEIVFSKTKVLTKGLTQIKGNRHHLYPKQREDIPGINKEKFLLRIWDYKHFQGWNQLFQFCFKENGKNRCSELTIDEILTLMAVRHRFITEKVGTKPWKILFGEKNLDDAFNLLCRLLAIKFNYQWQKIFPKKITLVVKQAA